MVIKKPSSFSRFMSSSARFLRSWNSSGAKWRDLLKGCGFFIVTMFDTVDFKLLEEKCSLGVAGSSIRRKNKQIEPLNSQSHDIIINDDSGSIFGL